MPAEFRNEIAARESQGQPNHGYSVRREHRQYGPILGRYQLTRLAQMQVGLIDADGNWRADNPYASSEQQFLDDPRAQERALAAYLRDNERQLRDAGAHEFIGRTFVGIRGISITVTEVGMAAAAHRAGAQTVIAYLRDLQSRNAGTNAWRSYRGLGDTTIGLYNFVETRLREFQRVSYRRLRPLQL